MKFLFMHVSIFSRPSAIEGHEWKEEHDPKLMLDFKVGMSCLLFLLVSGVLWLFGDYLGASFYVMLTLFSTLADAVFFQHYWIDVIDRVTATIGFIYMAWYSTRWVILCDDLTHFLVWIKLCMQVGMAMTPFKFLEKCRKFPVRSEMWRNFHVKWHITGTVAMILSICISQGLLDRFYSQVMEFELTADAMRSLLAETPLVDYMDMAEPLVALLEM